MEMDLAQKTPTRPNLIPARSQLLSVRDPSMPLDQGDEAVQWRCSRLLRLGAWDRGVASRGDREPISRLGWGFF